eukprot:TRINITY_DN399_c6_g1_i1.p1 TRINITY_DN399_c6_g1~~TRINITY_DN399_c6_g1_i1.p1  ORF type:complete len:567 (+),score=94.47 TRINITY_DN399_c6_g1_i1:70-1701(+)
MHAQPACETVSPQRPQLTRQTPPEPGGRALPPRRRQLRCVSPPLLPRGAAGSGWADAAVALRVTAAAASGWAAPGDDGPSDTADGAVPAAARGTPVFTTARPPDAAPAMLPLPPAPPQPDPGVAAGGFVAVPRRGPAAEPAPGAHHGAGNAQMLLSAPPGPGGGRPRAYSPRRQPPAAAAPPRDPGWRDARAGGCLTPSKTPRGGHAQPRSAYSSRRTGAASRTPAACSALGVHGGVVEFASVPSSSGASSRTVDGTGLPPAAGLCRSPSASSSGSAGVWPRARRGSAGCSALPGAGPAAPPPRGGPRPAAAPTPEPRPEPRRRSPRRAEAASPRPHAHGGQEEAPGPQAEGPLPAPAAGDGLDLQRLQRVFASADPLALTRGEVLRSDLAAALADDPVTRLRGRLRRLLAPPPGDPACRITWRQFLAACFDDEPPGEPAAAPPSAHPALAPPSAQQPPCAQPAAARGATSDAAADAPGEAAAAPQAHPRALEEAVARQHRAWEAARIAAQSGDAEVARALLLRCAAEGRALTDALRGCITAA